MKGTDSSSSAANVALTPLRSYFGGVSVLHRRSFPNEA